MSDELNEVVSDEVIDDVIVDESEDGTTPEEAPAEGDKPLNGYDKRISALTAQKYHERDARLKAEAELATLKAAQVSNEKPPAIPDFPDDDLRYSDPAAFRAAITARDEAIAERAAWKARQSIVSERETETRTQQATQRQSQHEEIVTGYIEGGLKSGISEVRMQANEQVLAKHSLNPDLAEYLYSDEHGAKLVDYLARNPDQLAELSRLPPTRAAVKIEREIRAKALARKPHVTNAPDPVAPTRGGGKPLGDEWDKLAAGATFE